jgi:hypothetical protein
MRIFSGMGSVGSGSNILGMLALSECCGYAQGWDGGSFMVLFRDSKLYFPQSILTNNIQN